MTSPEAIAESGQRRAALVLAALLLAAGLLVAVGPLIAVVTTADGSPVRSFPVAAAMAMLPGLLAVILALRRPSLGLAATAGAGIVGVVRLLADLAVLSDTDAVTRPELFVETTDRARPFAVGAGGWLLLTADLLMLTVGIAAGSRLGAALGSTADAEPDDIFGPPRVPPGSTLTGERGAPPDGAPMGSMVPMGPIGEPAAEDPGSVVALSTPLPGRLSMNLPMLAVGFLGAILLMAGALDIAYSGGYLGLRILPLGSSLTGVLAAALIALVAAVMVVVAASLPRRTAQALLAGTALAAAVPFLTAIVAVLSGAPTGLSGAVWWGLAGALILAAAGLLARRGPTAVTPSAGDGAPPRHLLTLGTGAAALLAAIALGVASRVPLLHVDGAAPDEKFGALLSPAGPPLLIAAIPLGIAGVLSLIGPTAQVGRAAVAVVWAGAVYALGQALWVRSRVLDSATNPLNVDLPPEYQHSWTAGPGLWLTVLGTVLAIAAAVLAVVTARLVHEASPDIVDDVTSTDSRSARRIPAAVLSVLVVIALALPVFGYPGRAASSTLLLGYDLDTWGVWAVAVAAIGGVWAAALTRRPATAAAWLVSAACVVGQPLLVPADVRAEAGFALGSGFWAGLVVVVVLVAAAPYFAVLARRVRTVTLPPLAPTTTTKAATAATASATGPIRAAAKGG